MFDITLQQAAMLLTIVLLIFGSRHISRLMRGEEVSHLLGELKRHMPVYSAETTRGTEAEFIRDRLPKRSPLAVALIAVVLFGAVAWWMSH